MIRDQHGSTLIEAMVAMTIMLVGAAAMAGLHRQALFFNGDGRKLTRAAAIASDLLSNLERLNYDDALLTNSNAANDTDLLDGSHLAEQDGWDSATATDHDWTQLPSDGTWPGVTPTSAIAGATAIGNTEYQVYWNVGQTTGATFAYKQLAAIVRWRHGDGWRRMVALSAKPSSPYIPP